MTPASRRRRGLSERPFLLFGLLLLLPALAFGLLGWQSVQREHDLQAREAAGEAEDVLDLRLKEEAAELGRSRPVRPSGPTTPTSRSSPPRRRRSNSWTSNRVPSRSRRIPRHARLVPVGVWGPSVRQPAGVLRPRGGGLGRDLADAYGAPSRERLERAPERSTCARRGGSRPPLRVVVTRGARSAEEELQIVQRAPGAATEPGPAGRAPTSRTSTGASAMRPSGPLQRVPLPGAAARGPGAHPDGLANGLDPGRVRRQARGHPRPLAPAGLRPRSRPSFPTSGSGSGPCASVAATGSTTP